MPIHAATGHAALRRGRRSVPGHAYLVTFATHGRQPLFLHEALARPAAATLADPRSLRTSRLLAWVLMPDHWHGLVVVGADDSLSRCVQRLKAHSARRVREAGGGIRVWGAGFHDRGIRGDDQLLAAARYVVANPLRAGLVERVGLYPYWDACWL